MPGSTAILSISTSAVTSTFKGTVDVMPWNSAVTWVEPGRRPMNLPCSAVSKRAGGRFGRVVDGLLRDETRVAVGIVDLDLEIGESGPHREPHLLDLLRSLLAEDLDPVGLRFVGGCGLR